MSLTTEFTQRAADYEARISRINRQDWMWQAPRSAGFTPVPRTTTVFTPIRRRIGGAIVRVGEQLRGEPTGQVADRAAV